MMTSPLELERMARELIGLKSELGARIDAIVGALSGEDFELLLAS
jgi:hypothetical protein